MVLALSGPVETPSLLLPTADTMEVAATDEGDDFAEQLLSLELAHEIKLE